MGFYWLYFISYIFYLIYLNTVYQLEIFNNIRWHILLRVTISIKVSQNFLIIQKKNDFSTFLVGLVAVTKAGIVSLSPSELGSYEMKLREYQNMTDIDEITFNRIWTTGLSNSKSNITFQITVC